MTINLVLQEVAIEAIGDDSCRKHRCCKTYTGDKTWYFLIQKADNVKADCLCIYQVLRLIWSTSIIGYGTFEPSNAVVCDDRLHGGNQTPYYLKLMENICY